MVEAAIPLLETLGVPDKRIYYDKFTTTGEPSMTETHERSVPKPDFTDAEAGAKEFPDSTARSYNYFTPAKRKQTHYEDVTVEVQPDPRHYLSQGWLYGFADGSGGYPLDWTALKAWGSDRPEPERFPGSGGKGYDWPAHGWHEFRDPNEEWELTFYRYNSNVVRQVNQNVENARQSKAFEQWNPNWVNFVARNVGAWMHVDHGLGLYLYANAQRRAPTNMHNNAISVNSMHRIRAAQDLALYNLTLTEEVPGFDGAAHLEAWNSDPAWQGVRETAEQLTSIWDWARGHLRRQRRVRAAGRRAVPQPAGAADRAAQRRLRDPDGRRRGRVRLRRARPALHHGDVRPAHHRPRVRRPQQGDHQRLAAELGAAGPSTPPASCSRCGRRPTSSRRGSRTASTPPRAGSPASSPTSTSTYRRSWPSDHA